MRARIHLPIPAAVSLLSLLTTHTPSVHAWDSPWTITPGIGHDQFEQTYFLEDTLALDPDSLRSLERTIEELKESYASVEAAYTRGATVLSNTFYATDAASRNVMFARTRLQSGAFRFDANGRLDWKGEDERDSISSSYLVSQVSATPRFNVNDHWSAFMRADFERTDYENPTSYGLDYDRVRGRLGLRYNGDMLESIDLSVGKTARDIPDSVRLSYNESWILVDASYWDWGPTTWSALVSLRDRTYERDGGSRDHQRVAFELSPRWQIRDRIRLEGLLAWEYWDYAQDSSAYFDFGAGEWETLLRVSVHENWEVALDGQGRWESAATPPFDEDDFAELAFGPGITWRPQTMIWVEMGSRWGRRQYVETSAIYDDYRFVELDVRADGTLGSHLTVSIAASYEQESHDDPSRDANYFYESFGVRYPIRL